MTVLILLASYNGEKYIQEQLTSLSQQSYTDIAVAIRDDCSTDSTAEIIDRHCSEDQRFYRLKHNQSNCGYTRNFEKLLQHALTTEHDYFMLCDQDDLWLEDKVKTCLEATQEIKLDAPILISTSYSCINESGEEILTPQKSQHTELSQLLCENNITGCTTLFNRKLLESSLPFPDGLPVHDWWLGLNCSYRGTIKHLDVITTLYRQHGNNSIGAQKKITITKMTGELISVKNKAIQYIEIAKMLEQHLSAPPKAVSHLARAQISKCWSSGIKKSSALKTAGLYLGLLAAKLKGY